MGLFIEDVKARQILDSRGFPTIEVDVRLSNGALGRAAVPSGASTGVYEALELRDGNQFDYMGKGVSKAVDNVNITIAPELIGANPSHQQDLDALMLSFDGTDNKSKLGANAILGVSMAIARAAALGYRMPLYKYLGGIEARVMPTPMMNILNGGVHADNKLDFQEFMITPVGAKSFKHALKMGTEVFHTLKNILKANNLSTSVGDEGGFAPHIHTNEEAIELIMDAISQAGYTFDDIKICLDVASSEFYENKKYNLENGNKQLSREEMVSYLEKLVNKYPIISIEDGMAEDDWKGWSLLTKTLGNKCQLVGDDLFVTNTKRISEGISKGIANSVLIKLNQIGTLTETLAAIDMAKKAGYTAIVSHRSGETEDTFIADLAVATNCGLIKTGSLSRSDRLAKYNQLLRIEEELGNAAIYNGIKSYNIK